MDRPIAGTRMCAGYQRERHAAYNSQFQTGKNKCRECMRSYLNDWRREKREAAERVAKGEPVTDNLPQTVRLAPHSRIPLSGVVVNPDPSTWINLDPSGKTRITRLPIPNRAPLSPGPRLAAGEYHPPAGLMSLWDAIREDENPPNLIFLGPSGCGKTRGAEYLAQREGLPFLRVDAPSMTDAESWFGTREIAVQDGVPHTEYRPSAFVLAIQSPGLTLIDEFNRATDTVRQVWLPLLDGSRSVTNPLTGEMLRRHPRHFIVMSGNRGIQFTGTFAVDPAFIKRSLVVEFDYPGTVVEGAIVRAMYPEVPMSVLNTALSFAQETRDHARRPNSELSPVSTRELLEMGRLLSRGMSARQALEVVVLNGVSDEGGNFSARATMDTLWVGVGGEAPGGREPALPAFEEEVSE